MGDVWAETREEHEEHKHEEEDAAKAAQDDDGLAMPDDLTSAKTSECLIELEVRLERVEEQLEVLVTQFAQALGEPVPDLVAANDEPVALDGDGPVGEEDVVVEEEEEEEEEAEKAKKTN